jgi:pyruvate-formate lyase
MEASADGRKAGHPLSEGIYPVQGADKKGPTAVIKSAGKMDHIRKDGTLLSMKFMPEVLDGDSGIEKLSRTRSSQVSPSSHGPLTIHS